uniref:Uncharacterized protein n=1 Tax=Panagrolaimus sp. PS1159 TaxID=55785 RepID=A0AC35FP87_9BILA
MNFDHNLIPERNELRSSRSSIRSSSECLTFGSLCFAPTLFDFPRLHGFLQFCLGYFAWEWLDLFGSRLTRNERVFFDEKNILETSKAFDFLLGPVLDDTTPGGTTKDPCCGKYPTIELIKGLIADPKQAQMQEFYKQHYGNMYKTALRASQEAKAAEVSATAISPSANSLKTIKSASKTESEISISPVPSKSNESQNTNKKND